MNVPQEELNAWRRSLDGLRATLHGLGFDVAAGRTQEAREKVQRADDQARRLALELERAGVDRPAGSVPAPDVPLRLMDTPANRRYAQALRVAWEAGLAVDRERYGEGIGTDGCAQVIEKVLADVEMELYGPAGARRG
jgi:hypothetical protein